VVAAAVAHTGATITDAVAMVSAQNIVPMSVVITQVTTTQGSAAHSARMSGAMDAQGMRMREITVEAGLRSVGAAQHVRTCAAATS
jgi:hypothetical protein